MPPYFIVKINIQDQKKRMQIENGFYTAPDYVFMTRNMQHGEIVSIGSEAQRQFPEAQVGLRLLFHHFVESDEKDFLIDSDEEYNYYAVPGMWFNGEKNLTYGVIDGEKVIPHKDYVFLYTGDEELPKTQEEKISEEDGFLLMTGYQESRKDKAEKMGTLKREIIELTKSDASYDLKTTIERKEMEADKISRDINKREYSEFKVAHISPETKSKFAKDFTKLGMLNIACHTRIEIDNNEYLIAETKYIAFAS